MKKIYKADIFISSDEIIAGILSNYKNLSKPISIAGFNNFCETESIKRKYIVNRNLNVLFKETKLIQGFLVNKLK